MGETGEWNCPAEVVGGWMAAVSSENLNRLCFFRADVIDLGIRILRPKKNKTS
jgi:hypothetical protein